MIPSPRLFRSRWPALFWAGGILWLAWDVAQANRHDAPAANATAAAPADALGSDALGDPVSNADLQALANAMGGG